MQRSRGLRSLCALWATISCAGSPAEPPDRGPFACGTIDQYDILALVGGGALDGVCADPSRSWRAVALELRADGTCPGAERCGTCAMAACAERLLAGAEASHCGDMRAYDDAIESPPCLDVLFCPDWVACW